MSSIKKISLLQLAQGVFILTGAIWVFLGGAALFKAQGAAAGSLPLVTAVLMLGNAVALLFCSWAVGQQQDKLDYLVLTVLILNLSLTITDQFGWLDALVLALYVILLGMVVMLRSRRKGHRHADQQRTDRASQDGAAPEDTERG